MLSEHNKQHHRKVLLSGFHPNCPHFIGKNFHSKIRGVGEGEEFLVAIQRNLE